MDKLKRHDKKNFKNKLISILMTNLNELTPKGKDKMKKFIDHKVSDVVDYYIQLLKKKNLKVINTPIKLEEIEKASPQIIETTIVEKVNIEEPSLQ